MLAYDYSKDHNLLDFGDTLYNAMFAKPGTCPSGSAVCAPDGQYLSDFDNGSWYLTGTPWNNRWHKYFGMVFGIGAAAGWPAYRIGGPELLTRPRMYIGPESGLIPGASGVRVTAIAPTGERTEYSCASTPCPVDIDGGLGEHIFQLVYLSANGDVVAEDNGPVVQMQ